MSAEASNLDENSLTWKEALYSQKKEPYFRKILTFIEEERKKGKKIFPKNSDIFNALSFTELKDVKVVILGQDPYHGPNQAHGLCFSVVPGVAFPPSLQNIFKELKSDLGISVPSNGSLEAWTKQGVLLLNTVLSVEEGKAHSHAGIGWETFTDAIIEIINERRKGVVFILWGAHAQKKCDRIDGNRHFIIKSPHPSPLSAHRGFLGSKPFSKTNEILASLGRAPINWDLEHF